MTGERIAATTAAIAAKPGLHGARWPWDDAGRGRAAAWAAADLDPPSDGVDAIRDAGQARASRRGSVVEAAPGVVDVERQFVSLACQVDRQGGAWSGVLGRVLDQLEAAEVDSDLDVWFAEA